MEETAPYPPLPEARGLRLRRFGTRLEDLEVDLSGEDRPRAITDVLVVCTVPGRDAGFYWDLPVGKRVECLLVLAALDGAGEIGAGFRCECGQSLEVTLTIDELLAAGRAAPDPVALTDGEAMHRVRRPNARDQAAWAAGEYADDEEMRRAIAVRLAEPGAEWDAAALHRMEGALDAAEPLVRATVEAACPDCGRTSEHEMDLAGFVLARLARAQDALLETVHLLASRYHWSEAEILALPAWRRSRYVALLQRETR